MNRMEQIAEGNDASRVAEVLAGDREAFRGLVDRHSRSIFRLAFRMTGNEQDAEEVVQETFLRAYRALGRFESRANFSTWLYRIAVNCSRDLLRRRRPDVERREPDDLEGNPAVLELPDPAATPDRLLLSAELSTQVQQAMGTLSVTERAAFLMRHFEGLSIGEIGSALGLGDGATKNSVFRAVQKLRRALEPHVRRTR
jgi:RNA polymerase sigma-70 factor, ECF subfamily